MLQTHCFYGKWKFRYILMESIPFEEQERLTQVGGRADGGLQIRLEKGCKTQVTELMLWTMSICQRGEAEPSFQCQLWFDRCRVLLEVLRCCHFTACVPCVSYDSCVPYLPCPGSASSSFWSLFYHRQVIQYPVRSEISNPIPIPGQSPSILICPDQSTGPLSPSQLVPS